MKASPEKKLSFWHSFLRAVETEPKDVKSLSGASGLSHPLVTLGIDEKRRRVVLVSGESDPRAA
jgi:hypothetical protein